MHQWHWNEVSGENEVMTGDRWLPPSPYSNLEPFNILTFLVISYLPPAIFYNAMSITTGIDLEIAITNYIDDIEMVLQYHKYNRLDKTRYFGSD